MEPPAPPCGCLASRGSPALGLSSSAAGFSPHDGRSPAPARQRRVIIVTLLAVHALAIGGLLIAPRTIPPSEVQYLEPPAPVYARMSAQMRESGKALVRVFIDERGRARDVQVGISSGFARLDDAALAAVRNGRFRPHPDNDLAVGVRAFIPIEFELPT